MPTSSEVQQLIDTKVWENNVQETLQGTVRIGLRTKKLVNQLQPGDIAIIHHSDLDETAAIDLCRARPAAIINASPFMTGHYEARGARLCLKAGIPLYEMKSDEWVHLPMTGEQVRISSSGWMQFPLQNSPKLSLMPFTYQVWVTRHRTALEAWEMCMEAFIENTLLYAVREKSRYFHKIAVPELTVSIRHKPVVIVVRGSHAHEDLVMLKEYITHASPVMIGVDGGADIMASEGYKPDIIIGDMDSVSDQSLRMAKAIVVHAYLDGSAPGVPRIRKLGLDFQTFRSPGTSEDAAMLLSHEYEAEWIIIVGAHTSMVDFMEKNRKGMASTLLTRMRVGNRLIDAKGVSILCTDRKKIPADSHFTLRQY